MTDHGEFTCANCGETHAKGRSDEEAQAEANELWGDQPVMVVVCEDCFQAIMRRAAAEHLGGTIRFDHDRFVLDRGAEVIMPHKPREPS